jgi:hypothetical protein
MAPGTSGLKKATRKTPSKRFAVAGLIKDLKAEGF